MSKLYKYLRADLFDLVFQHPDKISLRASKPIEFNDPFELFLGIDTVDIRQDVLAYYQEIVSFLPQYPTICFAKSPVIIPMWAHYARESTGFVVEFDEQLLATTHADLVFDDVEYSSNPVSMDSTEIGQAFGTGKPRYTYFINRKAYHAAYFTKSEYWRYEQERRMVIQGDNTIAKGGISLLEIPVNCVSAVIIGPKADPKFSETAMSRINESGIPVYMLHIGRSSISPFMVTADGNTYIFDGSSLAVVEKCCAKCKEPLTGTNIRFCHWCSMDEVLKNKARDRNPIRALASLGMLKEYSEGMERIAKRNTTP